MSTKAPLTLDDAEAYVGDLLEELGGSDGGRLLERLLERRKVAGPLTSNGYRYDLLGEWLGWVAHLEGVWRWRLTAFVTGDPGGLPTGGEALTRTGADLALCAALLERGYLVLGAP